MFNFMEDCCNVLCFTEIFYCHQDEGIFLKTLVSKNLLFYRESSYSHTELSLTSCYIMLQIVNEGFRNVHPINLHSVVNGGIIIHVLY